MLGLEYTRVANMPRFCVNCILKILSVLNVLSSEYANVFRGGSRVRLVCRMTNSRFLKKLDTFYEI